MSHSIDVPGLLQASEREEGRSRSTVRPRSTAYMKSRESSTGGGVVLCVSEGLESNQICKIVMLATQVQVLGFSRKNAILGLNYPLTDHDGDSDILQDNRLLLRAANTIKVTNFCDPFVGWLNVIAGYSVEYAF